MSSEKIKDKVKKDVRIFRSMFNNNRHSYYPSSKVVDKYAKSQTQSYIRLNNSFSSQIDLAAQALGKKRIDALIISSGGNDIGFSQVLENLYIKPGQLSADEILGASEKIKHARKNLENLNIEISKKLNVNKIYITEYPVRMFDDDNGKIRNGCGFINDRAFKVSTKEATRFVSVGRELNKIIKDTSKNLGWNYIGGIDEQFKGHGYCSTDSYFISATRSCKKQYDLRGMMHPNEKGVNAMADRISDVIYKNLIGEKAAKIISIL